MKQPTSSSLFNDQEYKVWIKELKTRIRNSQIKAAVRVNSSMLELYWSIGADIVNTQAESKWGSRVIDQLSRDLRREFPDAKGFSTTNLRLMKRFFLFYHETNRVVIGGAEELNSVPTWYRITKSKLLPPS